MVHRLYDGSVLVATESIGGILKVRVIDYWKACRNQ